MKYLPTSGVIKHCEHSEYSEISYTLKQVNQDPNGLTRVIGFIFTPVDIQKFSFVFSSKQTIVCAPYIHVIDGPHSSNQYVWSKLDSNQDLVPFLRFPKARDGILFPVLLAKILESQGSGPLQMYFYYDESAYRGSSTLPAKLAELLK